MGRYVACFALARSSLSSPQASGCSSSAQSDGDRCVWPCKPLHENDWAGARIAAPDRAYLALPHGCGIASVWDDVLSVAAHLALRRFARRLPGFADSHFVYLYRNFLDLSATVEEEPDRIVARVGRPPLHLVLNLTGFAHSSYSIPGEARPIAVFARD